MNRIKPVTVVVFFLCFSQVFALSGPGQIMIFNFFSFFYVLLIVTVLFGNVIRIIFQIIFLCINNIFLFFKKLFLILLY